MISMKPGQNSLFRLFFRGEPAHKLALVGQYESQRFRQERQRRFNYCTRQAARRAWMRDHRSIEICRFCGKIGNYKLKSEHGRQWLHGRSCVRPGAPVREIRLTDRYRRRVGGGKAGNKPVRKKPGRADHM